MHMTIKNLPKVLEAAEQAERKPMSVRFKKLDPKAIVPKRAKPGDVGYDLYGMEHATLYNGAPPVAIKTGIAIELPEGYYAQIAPRSGMGLKGVIVHGGVIDTAYRGDIAVVLSKTGQSYIDLAPGDKVAQLIILPRVDAEFVEAEELSDTVRGATGFGSSGN